MNNERRRSSSFSHTANVQCVIRILCCCFVFLLLIFSLFYTTIIAMMIHCILGMSFSGYITHRQQQPHIQELRPNSNSKHRIHTIAPKWWLLMIWYMIYDIVIIGFSLAQCSTRARTSFPLCVCVDFRVDCSRNCFSEILPAIMSHFLMESNSRMNWHGMAKWKIEMPHMPVSVVVTRVKDAEDMFF